MWPKCSLMRNLMMPNLGSAVVSVAPVQSAAAKTAARVRHGQSALAKTVVHVHLVLSAVVTSVARVVTVVTVQAVVVQEDAVNVRPASVMLAMPNPARTMSFFLRLLRLRCPRGLSQKLSRCSD